MTTAAVAAYYRNEHEALISYAGHPPVLYKRATDEVWSFATPPDREAQSDRLPMNLPFDIFPDTQYGQFAIPLDDGCTFYYSEQDILACDRKQSQILSKTPK